MKLYILKHKNGGHMALRPSGRGYTWSEPEEDKIPRLFKTRRGAEAAASWWSKGPIYNIKDPYGNYITKPAQTKQRSKYEWYVEEVII